MTRPGWRQDRLATPVGDLIVVQDAHCAVRAIEWAACPERLTRHLNRHHPTARLVAGDGRGTVLDKLADYFAGTVQAIDSVEVAAAGTPFQQRVWQALRDVPGGTTLSYGALARQLGLPGAARAVGAANGANPVSVILPCHRLVGHDGQLTGYAGGLMRKRWLLDHERGLARTPSN
jgi:methylated-DNA-[protein]-cysteine S-methyltransferase